MLDIQSLLDAFPEGVIQLRAGLVLAANEKARQYLPQLIPGAPLPVSVPLPASGETGSGVFCSKGVSYTFSCTVDGDECMLLFRPDVRAALEGWQMDGTLRQLRELLGDILAEVGAIPDQQTSASFNRTFYRLFRLIGNLEFMQQVTQAEGVPFAPTTVDLDGLCRETFGLAGELLRDSGVTLEYSYRSKTRGLLIPGDPQLLKKLLLGLVSNAVRATGAGTVSVILRRRGDQARIVVSGSGAVPDERQLAALFQRPPEDSLPLPGQGAGLGLPIARHIARLHGGTLLPFGGDVPPGVLVSLPTGPLTGQSCVREPLLRRDGGLNPVLVELSDVLPTSIFGLEGLD